MKEQAARDAIAALFAGACGYVAISEGREVRIHFDKDCSIRLSTIRKLADLLGSEDIDFDLATGFKGSDVTPPDGCFADIFVHDIKLEIE
jgi:hypothetical protein